MASRTASTRAISPSTWAVTTGVPDARVTASATWPAGLAPRPAAGGVLPGAGLGSGAGVTTGNRPAAFPAPMTLVTFTSGMGPGMAAGGIAGKRPAAFPALMSVLVALVRFGRGPRGCVAPRRDVPAGPFGEALAGALEDAGRVVLALAVGDTECVGLALGLGVDELERVGLAVGVGLEDAEWVGVGVGAGEVEPAGLGVGVGVGDAEGVALAVGAGADVDGEVAGDADVDDGPGVLEALGPELVLEALGPELVLEALGPELVLATAEEGEGEGVTLASAGSCVPTDSPETRKPPVTRPAATARQCARDM